MSEYQEYGREKVREAKKGSSENVPYRKKRNGKVHKKGQGNEGYRNKMKALEVSWDGRGYA